MRKLFQNADHAEFAAQFQARLAKKKRMWCYHSNFVCREDRNLKSN